MYLGVADSEITAECSAERRLRKARTEELVALPLLLRAEVELTSGLCELKESVAELVWSTMGWVRSCTEEANGVPVQHSRLGWVLSCELENCAIKP